MNKTESINITYIFKFSDDTQEVFNFCLDKESLQLIPENNSKPDWARLDFHQCPNCQLTSEKHPFCPLAINLAKVVNSFERVLSQDELDIEVITNERTILKHTTSQHGLSSMMGVLRASSGCPNTSFFKPMARFHLPFSNNEETVYRAVSMYLLSKYFCRLRGDDPDLTLEGLKEIYANMEIINASIAERLSGVSQTIDLPSVMTVLNLYNKAMPCAIEDFIDNIKYLFKPYLT